MIEALSETLGHLLHWSESCSCHRVPLSSLRSPHAATRSYFQQRYQLKKCPLQGCRAHDFANGRFTELLHGFLETSLANIALAYSRQLTEPDRRLLLDDCAQAPSLCSVVARYQYILSHKSHYIFGLMLSTTTVFKPRRLPATKLSIPRNEHCSPQLCRVPLTLQNA